MQPQTDVTTSSENASAPRIVIMAGDSPVSSYLVQELGRSRHISSIVRPIKIRRSKRRPRNVVRRIDSLVNGRFYGWHSRRLSGTVSRHLFGTSAWPTVPTQEIADNEINGSTGVRILRSLRPDILIVCGAPILKPQVFSIPSIGAINLHFGIAPKYRGQNTLFWALYHRDYENIGFTLHRIDQGVDAGAVIARGYPALDRHDNEATLWAKCARMACTVLTDFLDESLQSGQFAAISQPAGLRAYRAHDRTVWRDLHYAWRRRILNQRPRLQAAKIERFYRQALVD